MPNFDRERSHNTVPYMIYETNGQHEPTTLKGRNWISREISGAQKRNVRYRNE